MLSSFGSVDVNVNSLFWFELNLFGPFIVGLFGGWLSIPKQYIFPSLSPDPIYSLLSTIAGEEYIPSEAE